jgi:hypothetical protein
MKVRCIRLLGPDGKSQESSKWLTIGKIYHVLEVSHSSNDGRWLLRFVGEEPNGVALFFLEEFEVVTSKIPPTWIIGWTKGLFKLTPEPWSQAGFWDRYYDRDPDAIRVFEEERKKILEADP